MGTHTCEFHIFFSASTSVHCKPFCFGNCSWSRTWAAWTCLSVSHSPLINSFLSFSFRFSHLFQNGVHRDFTGESIRLAVETWKNMQFCKLYMLSIWKEHTLLLFLSVLDVLQTSGWEGSSLSCLRQGIGGGTSSHQVACPQTSSCILQP